LPASSGSRLSYAPYSGHGGRRRQGEALSCFPRRAQGARLPARVVTVALFACASGRLAASAGAASRQPGAGRRARFRAPLPAQGRQ